MSDEKQDQHNCQSAAAVEEIIYRYYGSIFKYCCRLLHNVQLAEDITQETFLRLYTHFDKVKPASVKAWLYRVAGNAIRDYWRSSTARRELTAASSDLDLMGGGGDISECKTSQLIIRKALNALPLKYKEVLVLRFYQELKVKEIAEILALPAGTVKSRLHYALVRLRKAMGEQPHEG